MCLGDENWIDCGTYWLHKFPQLSEPWKYERSFRLTVTNFSPLVNPSFYRGPDDVVRHYTSPPLKKSYQDQLASECGLRNEPRGRDWYRREYNVEVKEVGLAVPKWDPRLGYSSDGVVEEGNGVIEIKCPARMYHPICKYLAEIKSGYHPISGEHKHIFDSHYDQMQGGMAIMNKDWCDYVVYCPAEERVFTERIYFDPRYWHNTMYPAINSFLEEKKDLFIDPQEKDESKYSLV